MNPFSLESIKDSLLEILKDLAVESLPEIKDAALTFASNSVGKITRYSTLYLSGSITNEEYEDLMLGLRDSAELSGLMEAIAIGVKADETKNTIVKTLSSLALGALNKIL